MSLQTLSFGPPAKAAPPSVMPLLRGPIVAGIVIVGGFFGAFGAWAALAPLSSGAIASGMVNPDSSLQVITHFEGGIVRAIHVRNGQHVTAGEPLITLDNTRAQATYTAALSDLLRRKVERAGLAARSAGVAEMTLPDDVVAAAETEESLREFIVSQQVALNAQIQAWAEADSSLNARVQQGEEQVRSIEAETEGLTAQKNLIDEQIVRSESLLAQQLISLNSVDELRRQQAELASRIASNLARVSEAEQRVEEARFDLLQRKAVDSKEVAERANEVNNEIATLEQSVAASKDVLARTEIVSPRDGIVLNLKARTIGGSIPPGEPIMEVVPLDDEMVIVAKLQPRDIDIVSEGLQAKVALTPFSSRNLPPLMGTVTNIAPDSTFDELTRQYVYELEVSVSADELAKYDDLYMSPGMPAEVTVVTGERTMVQYLSEPLMRSLQNAFIYD